MEEQEGDGKVPKVYKDKAGKRYIYRGGKKIILKVPNSMSKADVIKYVKKHYPISKKKRKGKRGNKTNIKIINKNTNINKGSSQPKQPLTSHPPPNRLDPDVANEISRIRLAQQNPPNPSVPPGNPLPPQVPPVAGAQPPGQQQQPPGGQNFNSQQPPPQDFYPYDRNRDSYRNPPKTPRRDISRQYYQSAPLAGQVDKYLAKAQEQLEDAQHDLARIYAQREVLGDDYKEEEEDVFENVKRAVEKLSNFEERKEASPKKPTPHVSPVHVEEVLLDKPHNLVVKIPDDIESAKSHSGDDESPALGLSPTSTLTHMTIPQLQRLLREHGGTDGAKGTKGLKKPQVINIAKGRVSGEKIIEFAKKLAEAPDSPVPAVEEDLEKPTEEAPKMPSPTKQDIDVQRRVLQALLPAITKQIVAAKGKEKTDLRLKQQTIQRQITQLTTQFNAMKPPPKTPKSSGSIVYFKTPLKKGSVDQVGLGGGLFTNQIIEAMSRVPSFIGCIGSDQFPQLMARIKPHTRIGFISNLDPSTMGGSHWIAIALNGSDKAPDAHSIMYFDPFGKDIPPNMQKALDPLAEKIDPGNLMKLKINKVQHQDIRTDNCGFHSMSFLLNILSRHKSFADATGYKEAIEDKSGKYEKQIETLKKSPPFSFITMKGGSDAETVEAIDKPAPTVHCCTKTSTQSRSTES
jgi:hypothetical protein